MGNAKLTLAAALLAIRLSCNLMAQEEAHSSHPSHPKAAPSCKTDSDLDAALTRATSALEQAQYTDAIATLQPLAPVACSARIYLLLAAAYEGAGDIAGAESTLNKGHASRPVNSAIATSLARLYLSANDKENALRALNHFQPSSATPWREIQLATVVFLANHHLQDAYTCAERGYKLYPSLESILLLANTLQLEGRYKDVIALLNGQRPTYSGSASFLVTLAQSEYDAAMYDPARADVERAISLDGNVYAAHYLLGNLLLKLGDAEPAAAEYRTAIQLSPNQPRTYYYLALALRAQHNEADEEAVLTKAISLDSSYALAHCELGRILLNQNRLPDAVAQLELAVTDNASSEQAYYLLSRAYNRFGDQDKANAMAKRLAEVRRANHNVPASHSGEQGSPSYNATP